MHILLGFMYSNVPIERGLIEAKLYQYLEHLFKEKFAGSWKPQEKKVSTLVETRLLCRQSFSQDCRINRMPTHPHQVVVTCILNSSPVKTVPYSPAFLGYQIHS